ncbi:MAG TPA: CdaR family protein [Tepidisphaeraceae bacterium]|nr:CdaR family protein [Tepidisphaeraceae bacterium]
MADIESKTGQALGIPTATPKAEKRPTFSAAGKPTHIEQHSRAGAFKTFLWVAPLTALIWIYAEREQIDKVEVRVPIRLLSKSTDRIITVQKPADGMISLDIQGPRASLGELRDVLSKAPLDVHITPEIGYNGDISLAEPISKSDLFKTYAVTVSAARPPVNIKVEAKAAKRIPVKRRQQDTFVTNVSFEPETVVIEGPKDTLEGIKPENLVAYADLSDFASKPPGSYAPQDVPISLGSPTDVPGVTMKESVRAKVEISKSAPYNFAIPIVLQINGRVLSDDKFKISTTQDTLGGVEVIGPPDKIELLKQRNFPAAVVVDMTDAKNFDFATITTSSDKPYTLKPENYRMPPGVTVNNPTRDITITITRRGN